MPLWSFVAPHGSLELPAIIIAGGAGFRIGQAMLFPGGYRWKESVAKGGIEATQLVSGVIPMLVVAGCLEGFFSPSHAPVWLKFTVGGAAVYAAADVAVPAGEGVADAGVIQVHCGKAFAFPPMTSSWMGHPGSCRLVRRKQAFDCRCRSG